MPDRSKHWAKTPSSSPPATTSKMGSSSGEVVEVDIIYLWGMQTQNLFQNLNIEEKPFYYRPHS